MATADLHLPILLQHQLHVEFITLWVAVDYALVRVPSRIVIAITWQAEGSRNSPISCFPTLCSIKFFQLIIKPFICIFIHTVKLLLIFDHFLFKSIGPLSLTLILVFEECK